MQESSKGGNTPLGGWHRHLLATPSFHHAVQKTNELVRILEVREIFCLNDNKPEKSVKEILEISLIFRNLKLYMDL